METGGGVLAPESVRTARRHQRRVVLLAFLVAATLLILATWGDRDPNHYVLVHRFFDHYFAFGALAVLSAAVGLSLLIPPVWLRLIVMFTAVVAALVWLLIGWVASWFGPTSERHVRAPAGSDYEAIVTASAYNMPDPAWVLSIRQTGSLAAREFRIGCVEDHEPRATWVDPEHLRIRLHGLDDEQTVRVDSTTGEPFPLSDRRWLC